MTSRLDAWMPIYWGDYGRDTAHLNNAGHGAYLMLIKHYWCTGPLPDDDAVLWRVACCDSIAAWRKLRPVILELFHILDGRWHHKRVDYELAKARRITEAQAQAGAKGAAKRWRAHSTANGSAMAEPSICQWQNDAHSQSQGQSIGNIPPDPETPRTNSVPTERRADAHSPVDFQREAWSRGVAFLGQSGVSDRQARGLIGRWIKALAPDGDVKLLKLLAQAEANARGDPVPYVEMAIRNRRKADGTTKPTVDQRRAADRAAILRGLGIEQDAGGAGPDGHAPVDQHDIGPRKITAGTG